MQGPEEHAPGIRHGVRDDRAFGQLQIRRGPDHIVGHVEKAGRQRPELLGWQPAVALVHRLGQCIADTGAHRIIAGFAMPSLIAIASAVLNPMPRMSRPRRYGFSVMTSIASAP